MGDYKNVYYFRIISAIGGVEQFLYEIAKKYYNKDIAIYYDTGDERQLSRLRSYVKCIKREPGKVVKCQKFFANFNLDMIDDVNADDYYFVIHANFEELGYKPDIRPIIEKGRYHFIGVSKFACREFEKFTGYKAELCYNPLMMEPKEKVVKLVSACRLNDKVKGGERTIQLIKALDRYCAKTGRHYLWHIFTNETAYKELSPNVCYMQRRVDVRPFIQDADWCLQLSNDMETYCYTLNEAWCYGVHTISTPLSVVKELPVPEGANLTLDWNCENVDDIARLIFETDLKPFKYTPPMDGWEKLFAPGESQYQEELKMKYLVRALKGFENIIDNEVGRERKAGEEWEVDAIRLEQLLKFNESINIVEVVKEATPKPKARKAVKK